MQNKAVAHRRPLLSVNACWPQKHSQSLKPLDFSIYPATRPQNLLHLLPCIMSWSFRFKPALGGWRRGRGKRRPYAWHKPSTKLHSLRGPAAASPVIMELSLKRPPGGRTGSTSSGLGSKRRRVHTCCWDEACCHISTDWYKPWGGTLTRTGVSFHQCFQLSRSLKGGFNCNVIIFHSIYALPSLCWSHVLQGSLPPHDSYLSTFTRSLLIQPE